MKINLGISFLIVSAIAFTQTVYATSGACSSHGGVNCSLSNSYTSVICNDGSTDSSTKFSDLQECKVTKTCDSGQVTAFSASRGLLGSSFGQSASLNCEAINKPQVTTSVPSYTISESYLDEAVKRKATEYCVNKFGPNAIYKSSDKRCSCAEGYLFNSKDICSPKNDVLKEYWVKKLSESIATSTELKNIVDVNYIVDLVFKPENKGKTFKELIIETYYKDKTSTTTSIVVTSTSTEKVSIQPRLIMSKSLKIGSRGPEVSILQSMLGIEQTAYFGPKTREAVIRYQKSKNLPQTGVVGDLTRKELNK